MTNTSSPVKTDLGRVLLRGGVHAGAGLSIAFGWLYIPEPVTLGLMGFFTAVFLILEYLRVGPVRSDNSRLNRVVAVVFGPFLRPAESTRVSGATYLLIGSLMAIILFSRSTAFLAILFLGLGDPMATLIGSMFGVIRFRGKSMEGHLACFCVCLGAAALVGLWLNVPLIIAVTGASFATLFQALSLKLNDNITIPVGSGLAMWLVSLFVG